ncbi:MAG: filamentous hemagglutinin N-terminal domain-containing protein [Acidaminococcus fermentans]|uniref:filamentous hemagglutinin N-terminal domain-containing protein n=1 Tax=Acidaminococcus fermentans TaxID=905 RepID=UPI00242FBF98|nr:filamentous hemagglutinin N-terminal domain-containing protein [Acidaminococcus fermentans]MCF0138984.1 filamentous hemagglutinin N-terminal domain-containing protein [Acidaminococcus fermentans]
MDNHLKYSRKWKNSLTAGVLLALALGGTGYAMPAGGQIQSGQGAIAQNGKNMTVTQQSGKMAVDWTQFNIARDEAVKFAQPGRDAVALNRITGGQKSVIDGALSANGNLLLVNPNGVVFSKTATVDVGSLVASTAQLNDPFMKSFAGSTANLNLTIGEGNTSAILNEGTIAAQGGLVALHAAQVENTGTISNPGGTVALAAARQLTLSADSDGKLNYAVDGELAQAKALNSGRIQADGGYVVMTAKSAQDVLGTVVNNTGTIEAKTLRKDEKGQILLDGGNHGQVEVSGTLDASGMEDGQSAGSIKVIGQKTIVHDDTNLIAQGNVDGGKIETSGDVLNLGDTLNIDAKGVNGKAGEWLLDPLDVIIADSDPTTTSNYDNADKKTATDSDFTEGSASIGYNDPDATTANASSVNSAVTWISTDMVEKRLNEGTSVTVQAAATKGSANIIVKNDIDKTAGGDATLTLDAMRNITVNGNISSTSNKLNVVLNADSNGDQIGAVIINGNINTNGGDFTSASGGTVTYTSDEAETRGYGNGKLTGKADPEGHTVGTYFGHVDSSGTADGTKDDRLIKTGGGNITLNGEIAIGLNGGTLTLDSGGGAVTATGIINSGNSYGAYVYGTDTWNTLVEKTVEEYLKEGTVPAYHYQGVNYVKDASGNYVKNADGTYQYTTDAQSFSNGQPHYTFSEADTQNVRWLGDGSATSVSTSKGTGYASVVITKGSMTLEQWLNYQLTYNAANFANRYISQDSGVKIVTEKVGNKTNTYVRNADGSNVTTAQFKTYLSTALTNLKSDTASTDTTKMLNGETVYNNLKDDISHLLATNWFASKELAQGNTKGGSAAGDSYLATITTILENSLTTPNGQQILWAGGRGSGVLNKTGSTNNDKAYPYSYYGMPDDPTYQDGMYWVTGPEGEVNNGKGTQFYSNTNSNWKTGNYGKTVYGYVNWDTYNDGNKTRSQPDNSAPFLTVGYGTTGKWDDAAMGGDTTVGFIKETNLANSSLNIKAGSGTVNLEGDLGKAKALDTVNIESTGTVTLGNPNNTATTYHNGTVYADHGVYISGGTVSVGGEIHSGTTDTTASASDITTRSDGYQNTAFQLDSVTIKSAGDLTVHGVESDGYTGSDNALNGGKISLTSTGDTGKITLGAGVDYNGKATDGTLAAASAEKGAVVVDAQGSKGSLVNSTTGTAAITTGEKGTWQVYVNSPSDYGTSLGSNLNSSTNAQWTAKSDANSVVTSNGVGNKLNKYTDTSSNKFIFQVTPVITISGGSQQKTYGDTLTPEQLRDLLGTSATYKDSTDRDVDVTQFSNFTEADYRTYVTSSDGTKTGTDAVAVSSGGAAPGATRTNGDEDKTASDGNRAFYVFNVEENGAKALNGYDLKTVNGDIEILRKTLTINTDGTQTYGNSKVKSGTPSYDKTQLVNGDTLTDSDIKYTISTNGDYAASKGSNTTAHVRKDGYAGEYLTTGAVIKNGTDDVSANYEVTGNGTITVNPANLYLTVGDVSTTYGTPFKTEDYKYSIDTTKSAGFVNGDTQASVLGDRFLNYINTGAKTDANNDKVNTQNAGTYELQGSASKNLSDYTVHITNGKSTVNKATLTLTVGDVNTVYGNDFDKSQYTYTISGNANGDTDETLKNNQISVTYTNTGEKTDANNDKVKTQDVGDWKLIGNFTVAGDTANNYDVTYVDGTSTVTPAEIHLKLNDVSTTYGTAFTDTNTYGYDPSKLVMANGDSTEVVTKAIGNGDITYTNTGDAADPDKIAKGAKTQDAGTGYQLTGTTERTLQNYTVKIDGADASIDKATLKLKVGDYTEAYGAADKVGADLKQTEVTGEQNGDDLADLVSEIGIHNTSEALLSNTRTNNVKYKADGSLDSYRIDTQLDKDTLKNYNLELSEGTMTLTPVAITVDNEMIQTYGSADRSFKEIATPPLVNGDTISTAGLTMAPKAGGAYETNRAGRTTADAGKYKDDLAFSGGGIVHADGTTDASKNYKVTIKGDIIVNTADLTVTTKDVTTPFGTVKFTTSGVQGLTNGDEKNVSDLKFNYGSYGNAYLDNNSYTNAPGQYEFTTETTNQYLDFLKNYNILGGDAAVTITPVDKPVKPDITPDRPNPVPEGKGEVEEPSMDDFRGEEEHRDGGRTWYREKKSIPFFKVLDGKVTNYGTFDVESMPEKVEITSSGMRLPEPDQPETQHREYTTTLTLPGGDGTYRLVYNGVSFDIHPVDTAALRLLEAGDPKKNKELSEAALHTGFQKMGLGLEDLKAVYVRFN